MPTLAQTIYFEPHGYPGVTVSLDVADTERVEIQHAVDGPGTPSVISIYRTVRGIDTPTTHDLSEGDAEKIGRWLAAHTTTFDKVIEGGVAKFTRRHAVVYKTNPDTDGPQQSKLAFRTIDGHEWRFDATTLNWLALTPIKGADNYTVSYLVQNRPQREHTVSASTASTIGVWINFTKLFTKSGDDHAPQWTRTLHTGGIVGTRRVITDAPFTAEIDVALEQVILLARECGKSEEFASDIAGPLKLLLRLMIRDALAEKDREAMRRFTNTRLGQAFGEGDPAALERQRHITLPPAGWLEAPALECLKDVVSHSSDINEALEVRRLKAVKDDRKERAIDAPLTGEIGDHESYWIKQQHVFARMMQQAETALATHERVSK